MSERPQRARDWLVLAIAFLMLAIVTALWLAVDRRPPEWDHANHLERAVACAKDLEARDVETILERSSFYPPLVQCLAGLAYRIAPSDAATAQAVVVLFAGIGMVATYLLGRRLVDATTGLAAALLFGSAPFVAFLLVRFQLDLPLAAIVALALSTIVATEDFTRPGAAIAAGLVFGLGMLTKPSFPVYVGPPLLLVLFRTRGRAAWTNVGLAAVTAAALALPWYGPRLAGLPLQVSARSYRQAAESGHPDPFSWPGLTLYPRWFATQFGIAAALLFFAGLVVAVRRRQAFVLAALIVPFALFELIQNKNLRYTLPILPAAAVVAGMTFSALGPRTRRLVSGGAAALAVAQVSATLAGMPPAMAIPHLDVPWVLSSPPMRDDWKQREILSLIRRHADEHRGEQQGAVTVSIVPNDDFFSVSNFRYYSVRDGLDFAFVRAWDDAPVGIDYMVLKSGSQGPSWTARKPRRINERFATDAALARVFPVIGEYDLPDGSRATVRGRQVPPVMADPARVARAVAAAIQREVPTVARDVDGFDVALDWDDAIRQGRVRRIVLTARAATVGELQRRHVAVLRLHDVRITVDDALLNPWIATEPTPRFELLDARRITIDRARVAADDLQAFLDGLKDFRGATAALNDGAMDFTLRGHGPRLAARVRMTSAEDRPFTLVVDRLRYGGIPIPSWLVNWVARNYDPAPSIAARLPVPVRIGRVSISGGAIRIGGDPGGEGP